ncbi:hypothetical protein CRUP_014333, partial [Coryphaenoides rupestris]
QLDTKTKKRGGGAGGQDQEPGAGPRAGPMSLDEALAHLQQSQAHLDTLGHAFVLSLKDSQQEQLRGYSRAYDLSRSERSKVHRLAVAMATDGQPLRRIAELLAVAVGPLDLSALENNFSLRDTDLQLLLLYRTQAVLKDRP